MEEMLIDPLIHNTQETKKIQKYFLLIFFSHVKQKRVDLGSRRKSVRLVKGRREFFILRV